MFACATERVYEVQCSVHLSKLGEVVWPGYSRLDRGRRRAAYQSRLPSAIFLGCPSRLLASIVYFRRYSGRRDLECAVWVGSFAVARRAFSAVRLFGRCMLITRLPLALSYVLVGHCDCLQSGHRSVFGLLDARERVIMVGRQIDDAMERGRCFHSKEHDERLT